MTVAMTMSALLGPRAREYSKRQAFDLAIETFKRRFGPGWMLDDNRDDDAVVAET